MDESFFGGLARNKHYRERQRDRGRGAVGKVIVAAALDTRTNRISASVVPDTSRATLETFVLDRVAPGCRVYTDELSSYRHLPNHLVVNHSRGQYVCGLATVNGVEAFCALLKRAYRSTYHWWSPKHLWRYVNEFVSRHNFRPLAILERMAAVVSGMEGKRLRYSDLVG